MSLTASDIEQQVRGYLADEVVCQVIEGFDGRIGCLTPLEYPNGDQVTVWVDAFPDRIVVSDYGEAMAEVFARQPQDHPVLLEQVVDLCRPLDVRQARGQLFTEVNGGGVGEAVWRTASAAQMVAQAATLFRPRRRPHFEDPFVREIDRTLRERQLPVERERKLEGVSGHLHTVEFLLPDREVILEPLPPKPNWSQVSTVYTKFGDLSHANGYKLYTLVDDRRGALEQNLERILVQVGAVVDWSRRDEWLIRLQ